MRLRERQLGRRMQLNSGKHHAKGRFGFDCGKERLARPEMRVALMRLSPDRTARSLYNFGLDRWLFNVRIGHCLLPPPPLGFRAPPSNPDLTLI